MAKSKNEIVFTGVKFVDFHFVGKPKRGPGGPSLRVYFEADWSEDIRDAMEWTEIDQETVKGTPALRGALVGSKCTLAPEANELSEHAIKLHAQRIGNFEVFFPEQTGKQPKPPVLRFRIESADAGLETTMGKWGRELGSAAAKLSVAYTELQKKAKHTDKKGTEVDDKQEPLPLTGAALDEHRKNQKTTSIRRVKK